MAAKQVEMEINIKHLLNQLVLISINQHKRNKTKCKSLSENTSRTFQILNS
jgi:hypothetical protein